jgi:glycerol-3-phosphate acyltransferase PlsX
VQLCAELVEKDITRQVTEDLANFRRGGDAA